MENSKPIKKNKKLVTTLILLVITSTMLIALVGCGGFNEVNAKQESKVALDNFLKVDVNGKVIAKDNQMDKIRAFVNTKCAKYFTKEFTSDTKNMLTTTALYNNDVTFYILSVDPEVTFYNNYKIDSPVVDIKNETVTYKIETKDPINMPTTYANIQMKKENGTWKINKTE